MRPSGSARVVCTFEAVEVGAETGGAYAVLLVASESVGSTVRAIGIHMSADEADELADRLKKLSATVRSENKRLAAYDRERASAPRAEKQAKASGKRCSCRPGGSHAWPCGRGRYEAVVPGAKRCPNGLDPNKCGACANLPGYDH